MACSGPVLVGGHWQQGSRFVAAADQNPRLPEENGGGDVRHSVFQTSAIIIDAVGNIAALG